MTPGVLFSRGYYFFCGGVYIYYYIFVTTSFFRSIIILRALFLQGFLFSKNIFEYLKIYFGSIEFIFTFAKTNNDYVRESKKISSQEKQKRKAFFGKCRS